MIRSCSCRADLQGASRGSASATANADGSLNSVIQYTAFSREALPERSAGRGIRLTQGMTPTKYRYTGQLAQAELGLDYYVARWYDPILGQFTQADGIIPEPGKNQSFDRYAYSYNNPLKYTDPSRHFIAIPILVALIGITGFAGGAAYYKYNVSSHSWWESKEYTTATIDAGMKGATIAYSATLVAIEAAVVLPALAAQVGILLNNPSIFNW